MKLILANPRGFCAGVYMAIDVVDQLLDICPDETICVYHEIVHNRHVVDRFKERGVLFVESIQDAPKGSIVVFSAHGVSPTIRAESSARDLVTVDATCPLVTKVHAEAIRLARKDFQILLIGHSDHQEVIGTRGEVPEAIVVVESVEDIEKFEPVNPDKIAYLTQTTLSTDDASKIIDAIRRKFPNIKEPNLQLHLLCNNETDNEPFRALAPSCDLVLVVGKPQTARNSVRLTEISEKVGSPAHLIDDAREINPEWFEKVETVLITAGASAPEDLVRAVITHLVEVHGCSVEQHHVDREDIEFGLPGTLKRVMRAHGIDPEGRSIRVDFGNAIDAWLDEQKIPHSTVDLTVGATE